MQPLVIGLVAVIAFLAGYWYAIVGLPGLIDRGLRKLAVALPSAVAVAALLFAAALS